MSTQRDARRSTSALLFDESAEEKQLISEEERLLGCTDISESYDDQPFYRRIRARYGLFESLFSSRLNKNEDFGIFSYWYMDIFWVSLFVYVTCEFISSNCSDG